MRMVMGGHVVTTQLLRERLKVSRAQAKRYMVDMVALGVDEWTEQGRGGPHRCIGINPPQR